MKRQSLFFLVPGILMVGLIFSACNDRQSKLPAFDPAASAFVNAFTTGEISKTSTIRVHFTEQLADSSQIGQEAAGDLFSFTPEIKGKARWEDGYTLAFDPEQPLPSGQVFSANLKLKNLFPEQKKAGEDFGFHFRVRPQSFDVEWTGNEAGQEGARKWHTVRGRLIANDKEEKAEIVKLVQASYRGKPAEIEWEASTVNSIYAFEVKQLERGDSEADLVLNVKGKALGASDLTKTVTIPSVNDFSCARILSFNGSDQHIVLEFSDPVAPRQSLEGLIRIEDYEFTSSIDGNRIVLYPQKRLVGNVEVSVSKGIESTSGKETGVPTTRTVTMDSPQPQVATIREGTILPRSEKTPYLFKSVGLNAVDVRIIKVFEDNISQFLQVNSLDGDREMVRVGRIVAEQTIRLDKDASLNLREWNTHSIDLSDIVDPEPGALYQVAIGFRKGYYVEQCDEDAEEDIPEWRRERMPESMLDMPGNWDDGSGMPDNSFWNYYYYYGDWDDREDPCKLAYYRSDRAIRQNILSSNLGLIVKRGDKGEALVAVTDLLTTKPVSGASIQFMSYQQQVLAEGTTNADGLWKVTFPDKPFLLTARYQDQVGYLKLNDGNALSFSRFDVGGSQYQGGLKGFLYGERGVWRPGDPIYLTFLLEDQDKALPAGHPVTLVLKNPQGQEVDRQVKTRGINGFYAFETRTGDDAVTGTYLAEVEVGGAKFTKSVKVETIMPNRLKISMEVGEEGLKESEGSQRVELEARWLHGAKAGNLKAKVQASLRTRATRFPAYQGFDFDDPAKRFSPDEETFFDGTLDADGKASFPVKLSANGEAPGMLSANFVTRVFERGGAASVDRFSTVFHPYGVYTGVKVPKGDVARGMLLTDTEHPIEVVTVNTQGKPVASRKVTLELYKVNWQWWWHRGEDNLASYLSRSNREPILKETVSTNTKGEATWNMQVNYPDWGRYYLRATDEDGHSTGRIVYIDWPGWAGRAQGENPGGASMLVFNADKKEYTVGENVKLTIPSPNGGRALISLESGNRVLKTYWLDCQEGGSTFTFEATRAMAPNIYVTITLIQPHAQTVNDLPLRLYGVIPVGVKDPETILEPVITTVDEFRPNSTASITVGEKGGGPMTYTVAVVDEGLLGITRFQTPNPHQTFYEREALNIKTWDQYEDVIGAYGGKVSSMLSIGGDGEGADAGREKQNRFRPVVEFLGPFTLKAGKKNKHDIQLPNYVGAVRVMVVAGTPEGAYGSAEKEVPVRAPIMLAATLPRVLGPGERSRLPVSVFVMKEGITRVDLSLAAGGLLSPGESSRTSIDFTEPGEKMAFFEVVAAEDLGTGTVSIKASGGGESASYETDIQIRIANARQYLVADKALPKGETWTANYKPLGMKGTNAATLEVSSIPPLNLEKRLRYLIRYPYGCVEQTTSSAFPQLFLANLTKLSPREIQRTADNIRGAIERLQTFQMEDGAFKYWPGNPYVNNYATSYAGHFLVEAKRAGYEVPDEMLKNWRKYQRKTARDWKHENQKEWDQLNQAYRLLLLALDGNPEMGAMNRLRKLDKLNNRNKWLLAAAYHLAGRPEASEQLLKDATLVVDDYRELGYTYGSNRRDQAIMLYAAALANERSRGAELLKAVSNNLGSNRWLSTQETGVSLMAVAHYLGNSRPDDELAYEYRIGEGAWQKVKGQMRISQHSLEADQPFEVSVRPAAGEVLFVRLQQEGIPLQDTEEAASRKINLSVKYLDENNTPLADVSALPQGKDFTAVVTITHAGEERKTYQEIALDQIFPSGWEILNHRLDGSNPGGDAPEYQDFRDDRVYSFFDLPYGKSLTIHIRLNAAYQGRYYLPAVSAHAMYDDGIYARNTGKWVDVVPAEGQ